MLATHCPEGYPYARFRDLAPGMRIQAASAQILGFRLQCLQPHQVYTVYQADKDGIQLYINCEWGRHFLVPANGIIPFFYGPLGQRPQRLVTPATAHPLGRN